MKATAESYTITTALIVVATAITVHGGDNQDGILVFTNNNFSNRIACQVWNIVKENRHTKKDRYKDGKLKF
ncbi:hypothetical protein L1887_18161 [Cichorium endivia]|nr:hypothetical protein L1887_18161 [Cichorium endivia]